GENPVAIAYKQVHDQPTPLNRLVEGVPRAFEAIVATLLAKDPKLRSPSAHALRADLRRFRNGEQVQALVAAAARPGAPAGGVVRPTDPTQPVRGGADLAGAATTIPVSTGLATGRVASTQAISPAHPQIAGAPTTAMPQAPRADLSHYPPGASA